MGRESVFFFLCSYQIRGFDVGIFRPVSVGAGIIGHESGERWEPESHSLGFEFIDVLLQVIGAGAFAKAGHVYEVVVERKAYNGAGFETYE